MPPRIGKVNVTLSLDAQLVLKAKLGALRRTTEQARTITLEELVEAGLRKELTGAPERKPQTRATKPETRRRN
jgi:hypothetical protein